MSATQILLAVLAVTLVTLSGFGIMRAASAHGERGTHFGMGKLHKTHWLSNQDWKDDETLNGYKQECKERGSHRLEEFVHRAHKRLGLSAAQESKWQELRRAITSEAVTVSQICDKIFTRENHTDTPARMELLTVVLAMSSESLLRLQPYVNDFYQALDEKQRNEFDNLMSHHQQHGFF